MRSSLFPFCVSLAVAALALLPTNAFSEPTMVESFYVKLSEAKKDKKALQNCSKSFSNELVNTRAFKETISREIEQALSTCIADESNPTYAQSCDLTSVSRTVDLVLEFSVEKSGKALRLDVVAISPMEGYSKVWGDSVTGSSDEAFVLCGDLGQRFLTSYSPDLASSGSGTSGSTDKNGSTVVTATTVDDGKKNTAGDATGFLVVKSEPEGAEVMVNGKSVGPTPYTGEHATGACVVEISKGGYKAALAQANVSADDLALVQVTLEAKIVDLSVLSSYGDGRSCEGKVLVDGEAQGNTPLKLKVLAARHSVEVQCDEGGASVEVDLTAGEKKSLSVEISLGPKTLNGYALIKAGSFQMGSPTSETDRGTGETQHQVTLTRDFFLKTTEVTQGEWRAVMGNNPSYFSSCGDDCPVENVSWYDSLAYLNALSKSEGAEACYELSGCSGTAGGGCSGADSCTGNYSCTVKFKGLDCKGYRLPTEAEWEVAARAGSTGKYSDGSSSPDAVAWHSGNSDSKTHTVSQKSANAWGLYDMHGNVWEWTWDWSGDYPAKATDPQGADSGTYRVFRGGSWYVGAANARSASRGRSGPAGRYGSLGFRPARSLP